MSDPRKLTVAAFTAEFPELAKRVKAEYMQDPVFVFDTPHVVEGDFSIDRDKDTEAGAYVFLSDLTVTGNLLNWNRNYGVHLAVDGHTTAQNIIAGGAFIYLHTADVPGVVFGHYNDGYIEVRDHAGLLSISDDHHMNLYRSTPHVSFSDFPNSGRDIFVDDIRLPYDTRWEVTTEVYLSFFRDSPWIEVWTDDPDQRDLYIEEGEFTILWEEFVKQAIQKGAPATDDSFAQLADLARRSFVAGAADTDRE